MTQSGATGLAAGYAWRVSLFYGALFSVTGVQLPFFPVWLDWRGMTAQDIAFIGALPMLARVIAAPLFAHLADRSGRHRQVLIWVAWSGCAALMLLGLARGFWTIFALSLAFAVVWTAVIPLTETIAVAGVRAAGLDYGHMRVWGSLTFVAANFAGGLLLDGTGPWAAIWLIATLAAATALAALVMPAPPMTGVAHSRPSLRSAFGLVREPVFLTFLVATGAVQAAHAVFYTFGTLHWRASGLSAAWCGGLWAIGIVAEILLFTFSAHVLRAIEPVRLMCVGAAAAVVRWLLMGFDPPLAALIPLQVLHGITYGATHLGAIHFIGRRVGDHEGGTAQALYASVNGGIAMGLAVMVAGHAYAAAGGRAYWAMAALAAVGLAASVMLERGARQPHSSRVGGAT